MKPNFFIIGAPKSGTTALSEYLRSHDNVFISVDKEPNYWNDDFKNICTVRDYDEYLALFRDAGSQHHAIGEASVNYLRSARAVPRIVETFPDARFVVLLRNPVDLAYSWHGQMVFGLYEDDVDFESAWRKQAARRRGELVPATCVEPKVLDYFDVAALGSQVQRLMANTARDSVQIHLFDDFKKDPGKVYRDTLAFLGLADDGRSEFPVINENKSHRNKLIARFVERPPALWVAGARAVRRTFGIQRIGLLRGLRERNKVAHKRAPMSPNFRAELIEEFRAEFELLSEVLGRDLSDWLSPQTESVGTEGV